MNQHHEIPFHNTQHHHHHEEVLLQQPRPVVHRHFGEFFDLSSISPTICRKKSIDLNKSCRLYHNSQPTPPPCLLDSNTSILADGGKKEEGSQQLQRQQQQQQRYCSNITINHLSESDTIQSRISNDSSGIGLYVESLRHLTTGNNHNGHDGLNKSDISPSIPQRKESKTRCVASSNNSFSFRRPSRQPPKLPRRRPTRSDEDSVIKLVGHKSSDTFIDDEFFEDNDLVDATTDDDDVDDEDDNDKTYSDFDVSVCNLSES
jgi:hypothetical protein